MSRDKKFETMKPLTKWASVAGVVIAMLLLFYYTGVINSAVSLGVACGIIGGTVLLFMLFTRTPKK